MVLIGILFSFLVTTCTFRLVATQYIDPAHPIKSQIGFSSISCPDSFTISSSISPSLGYRPLLACFVYPRSVCSHGCKVSRPRFSVFLLLLAGDISANPGPGVLHNHTSLSFKVGIANLQSIRLKGPSVASLVEDIKLNCFMVTETWLKPTDTTACIKDLTPKGFNFLHKPRTTVISKGNGIKKLKTGGGVGCFINDKVGGIILNGPDFTSFEYLMVSSTLGNHNFNIVTVYHPPGPTGKFYEDFQDLLSYLASQPLEFIIGGDFNLHLSDSSQSSVFNNILDIYNLTQHRLSHS